MTVASEDVLDFWFGPLGDDGLPEAARQERWFDPPPGFDEDLRERFGESVEAALSGALDGWADTPRGRLALIVLLDQWTRNLYRGTARAFAGDPKALALALEALEAGEADGLAPIECAFLAMPLMHAEDLAMQDHCVAFFAAQRDRTDGALRERLAASHAYAVDHREPIARFGRFPSRNSALGRATTDAEAAWLAAHPGGF